MKLDSEPIYAHSTLAQRPDSHFFEYNNNTVETAWKMNNEIMGEDKRKVVSDRDIKKCDTNTDSLLTKEKFEDVKSRRHDLVAVENSVNGGGMETENPFHSNDIKLSEKEIEFYTDKSVTDSELPELMVCYKEFEDGDYHVVKDICIDEGLPSLGKILVDNDEVVNEGVFSSMHSDLNGFDDLAKQNLENAAIFLNGTNPFVEYDSKTDVADNYGLETLNENSGEDIAESVNVDCAASSFNGTNPFVECDSRTDAARKLDSESSSENGGKNYNENVDSEAPILNGTNPFLECDSETDVATESGPESLTMTGEEDCDKIVNAVADEKTMPETLAQESDVVNSPEPSDKAEDQQQSDQDRSKEAHSADSMMSSTLEESNKCGQAEEVPFNSQVKSGSITYDSDPSSPATSGKEEDPENTDGQQSVETLSTPSIEEGTEDIRTEEVPFNSQIKSGSITYGSDSSSPATSGKEEDPENTDDQLYVETFSMPSIEEETADIGTVSSRSFFITHGHGETSFGPLSGPIAHSGQIPYSGSVSLRSDSSTTSTRSFAFPILNTEWPTSPVRMAKADKRHFRKHRGWRISLLCCRF